MRGDKKHRWEYEDLPQSALIRKGAYRGEESGITRRRDTSQLGFWPGRACPGMNLLYRWPSTVKVPLHVYPAPLVPLPASWPRHPDTVISTGTPWVLQCGDLRRSLFTPHREKHCGRDNGRGNQACGGGHIGRRRASNWTPAPRKSHQWFGRRLTHYPGWLRRRRRPGA